MEAPDQVAQRWAAKCEDDARKHYGFAAASGNPDWQRIHRQQAEASARLADKMRAQMNQEGAR